MAEATNRQRIEDRVRELADRLVVAEGLELVDLEFLREQGRWVLRLYVDKPGGGIGLDECAAVSHVVGPALDVEDLIEHEYSLEVSSPGLNRPLKKVAHFERALGQRVRIKTYGPLFEPPRKNFLGVLEGVTPQGVTIRVDGAGAFTIEHQHIARANLEPDFDGAVPQSLK